MTDARLEKALKIADDLFERGVIEEQFLSRFYEIMTELRNVDRMKRFLKVGEYEEDK